MFKKWSSSIALALALTLCVAAQAQMAGKKLDVRRVGARLACQCGCPDTVASCSMMGCPFSPAAREKIAQMQSAGTKDPDLDGWCRV
jgi:hypothetical protein